MMPVQLLITILICLLLFMKGDVMAVTCYVSPLGNDASAGTQEQPFRTIQHAADQLRPGDTCVIHGGEYGETVTVRNSGTEGAPITLRAAEGEAVTITGAEPVTGWIRGQENIYTAPWNGDLGKNNQLFFDGRMMFEARWPHRTSDDLFAVQPAKIDAGGAARETGGDAGWIICHSLPDLPDDAWKGAVIWVMAGSKWTSWTATITGYVAAQKKLLFEMPQVSWVAQFQHPRDGGVFYLSGVKDALGAANEWYYDAAQQQLYLWAPGGADPNQHRVTAKRRLLAVDLHDRSYVQIIGVNVHAATIDLDSADHCLVQGMHATYISHTRGGQTGNSLNVKTGIFVSGTANTIRDSEIAFSAGDGVALNGTDQRLINCWVHDTDYLGCYASAVRFSGSGHLISHNTINDTGRDLLQYSGTANVIQYNHIYRCGLLAEDLGFTYTVATDGGNTELHHNWFHDNMARYGNSGVYFDNFTSNYLVHHNVIWGRSQLTLHLNRPSSGLGIYNNTIIGQVGQWGRWDEDRMHGDVLANNLVTDAIDQHPDMLLDHNLVGIDATAVNAKNFQAETRPGRHVGRPIAGITDGFTGPAPDLGAYISGQDPWVPGHDFTKHPTPEYRLTPTPYRNLLFNAGFEQGELDGWQRTDAGKAVRQRAGSSILSPASSRNAVIGSSACLDGETDDGIAQTVSGLLPNTRYCFSGYLKAPDGNEMCLGVKDHESLLRVTAKNWAYQSVEFTTGAAETTATVFVRKVGAGVAYVDWLQLSPVLASPEIHATWQITAVPIFSVEGKMQPGSGVLRVHNNGTEQRQLTFDLLPSHGVTVQFPTTPPVFHLAPGAQEELPFTVQVTPAVRQRPLLLAAFSQGDTGVSAMTPLTVQQQCTVPLLARTEDLGQLAAALHNLPAWPVQTAGVTAATVHAALCGDALAIQFSVLDRRMVPQVKPRKTDTMPWESVVVEIFLSTVGEKLVHQIAFSPAGFTGGGKVKFYESGNEITAMPVLWKVSARSEYGYELTALVPLSAFHIPAKAPSWLFDVAVTMVVEPDGAPRYLTLSGFGNAYFRNEHFLLMQREMKEK